MSQATDGEVAVATTVWDSAGFALVLCAARRAAVAYVATSCLARPRARTWDIVKPRHVMLRKNKQ